MPQPYGHQQSTFARPWGSPEGACPLWRGSGGVPQILCDFPRVGGWDRPRPCYGDHTDAPHTGTRPRLDKASALPQGQSKTFSLRCCRGPTVNQAVADNLESGRCPQKNIFPNDQTIKTRPLPGYGTERRPAPPFGVDAGHDIVSRPISRVLYPPERTVAISLGWRLPTTSSDQPEDWAGHPIVLLFGLAPGGVCPAGRSPDRW